MSSDLNDPLRLRVAVADPLVINVSSRDPLALTITAAAAIPGAPGTIYDAVTGAWLFDKETGAPLTW